MGYGYNQLNAWTDEDKDQYLRLISQYTSIDKAVLDDFAKENPVSYIFEYMNTLPVGMQEKRKLQDLKELIGLHRSLTVQEKKSARSPDDVAEMFMEEMSALKKECFVALLLDVKNNIIKKSMITEGALNSAIVHPREVFKEAIEHSAFSVIFLHNHPSGDPTPSKEDISLTNRLLEAGEILGIRVADHIIIGNKRYFSMRQECLIGGKKGEPELPTTIPRTPLPQVAQTTTQLQMNM